MCMCVCWEGLQSGMAESFLYTISSPTPSISLQFLSLLEKKLGTSFPAMSLDLWLCDNEIELKKNNTPGCRHREQTYGHMVGRGGRWEGESKGKGHMYTYG